MVTEKIRYVYGEPGPFEFIFEAGDLVFDVGACIGQMTAWYVHRGARVIAVEPEAGDVADLRKRFEGHPSVTIVYKAVGEAAGEGKLHVHAGARAISTFVPDLWWGKESAFRGTDTTYTETVQMTTLDALIEEYGRPQFIKLDIEGYELYALRGLTQPVPFIQFEVCASTFKSGDVRRCFEHILDLAPHATFNYMLCEGPGFMIGPDRYRHWTSADEVLEAIRGEVGKWPHFWGNGLANMTADCGRSDEKAHTRVS